MESGVLTRTCFLAGRLSGRTARISQDSAKACASGLVTKTWFLAGRMLGRTVRISRDSGKAIVRGPMRAATWTTQRVASSARLLATHLKAFNWRKRGKRRGLQRETEIRVAERRRIGQDLHNGVGQTLSGVAFMSRALERKLAAKLGPGDDPGCSQDAAEIAEIAEEAIAETRSMARMLNRAELSAGGLMLALGEMASDFEKVFGVSCTFEHDAGILIDIDDDAVATHLYRIAQEAATNAIRHGGAKHVVIGLSSDDERTTLTVQDDGTGFAVAETVGETVGSGESGDDPVASSGQPTGRSSRAANGMGLRIMECRAKDIGGSLSIRRRPEGGTVLTCAWCSSKKGRSGPRRGPDDTAR